MKIRLYIKKRISTRLDGGVRFKLPDEILDDGALLPFGALRIGVQEQDARVPGGRMDDAARRRLGDGVDANARVLLQQQIVAADALAVVAPE